VSEVVRGTGIPEPVHRVLRSEPEVDSGFDQAIPLLTVDGSGFPHVALLSRAQLRPSRHNGELLASVWGPGTRGNLLATRRATIVVIAAQAAYYLKLSVVSTVEHAARLGVILRMAECTVDSAGVELSPLGFRRSAELAEREDWNADARVLDMLQGQA
jgi:hypothetical protein